MVTVNTGSGNGVLGLDLVDNNSIVDVTSNLLGDGSFIAGETYHIVKPTPLTVNKSGPGSGTVTSSPLGINCGSDCSEAYANNTQVILTASPSTGSTFTGWSGGECYRAPASARFL